MNTGKGQGTWAPTYVESHQEPGLREPCQYVLMVLEQPEHRHGQINIKNGVVLLMWAQDHPESAGPGTK